MEPNAWQLIPYRLIINWATFSFPVGFLAFTIIVTRDVGTFHILLSMFFLAQKSSSRKRHNCAASKAPQIFVNQGSKYIRFNWNNPYLNCKTTLNCIPLTHNLEPVLRRRGVTGSFKNIYFWNGKN